MSKIRRLCLGVGSLSLLFLGLFSLSTGAIASSECSTPHQIAAGENVTVIAASYGVTVDALIEENGLADANLIVIGQTLCIPAGGSDSGSSESTSSGGDQSSRTNEDWSSYGIPGESYDPATLGREGGSSYVASGNGPQEESRSSRDVYLGVPGKDYDPVIIYAPEPQPSRSTVDDESDEEPTPTPVPTPIPTPDDGGGNEG